MVIEWTISIGNLLTFIPLLLALATFMYKSGRFTQVISDIREDVAEMKNLQKDVATAITQLAVQDHRLTDQDRRITTMQTELDDFRHGRGFIVPSPYLPPRGGRG